MNTVTTKELKSKSNPDQEIIDMLLENNSYADDAALQKAVDGVKEIQGEIAFYAEYENYKLSEEILEQANDLVEKMFENEFNPDIDYWGKHAENFLRCSIVRRYFAIKVAFWLV